MSETCAGRAIMVFDAQGADKKPVDKAVDIAGDGRVPGRNGGRLHPPWQKGEKVPGAGRPPTPKELQDMCRMASPEAVETAKKLMRKAKTERVKLLAVETILDRGYGKPKQSILHEFEQYTNEQLLGILVGRAESGSDRTGEQRSEDPESGAAD